MSFVVLYDVNIELWYSFAELLPLNNMWSWRIFSFFLDSMTYIQF